MFDGCLQAVRAREDRPTVDLGQVGDRRLQPGVRLFPGRDLRSRRRVSAPSPGVVGAPHLFPPIPSELERDQVTQHARLPRPGADTGTRWILPVRKPELLGEVLGPVDGESESSTHSAHEGEVDVRRWAGAACGGAVARRRHLATTHHGEEDSRDAENGKSAQRSEPHGNARSEMNLFDTIRRRTRSAAPLARATTLALLLTAAVARSQEITAIDLYGARTVPSESLLAALQVAVGDDKSFDAKAAAKRVEAVDGVAAAKVTKMNLAGRYVVVVFVREAGRKVLDFLPAPTGDARLPAGMRDDYGKVMKLQREAMQKNVLGEDRENGYALQRYQPAREIQLANRDRVRKSFETVCAVLATSADASERAAAAYWLAYGDDRAAIATRLGVAVRDPDSVVRNNASRALAVLAEWSAAQSEPQSEPLVFDATPFLAMLDSVTFTDVNKATMMLHALTARAEPKLFQQIRETGLQPLRDVACWASPGHAFPAALVLGRLNGLDYDAIRAAFGKRVRDPAARRAWVDKLVDGARR